MSDFSKADKELIAAESTLEEAEKGYSIAEVRYTEGVGTQLEVLDAQLQLNNSRVRVLQAKYNRVVAYAAYQRSLGGNLGINN